MTRLWTCYSNFSMTRDLPPRFPATTGIETRALRTRCIQASTATISKTTTTTPTLTIKTPTSTPTLTTTTTTAITCPPPPPPRLYLPGLILRHHRHSNTRCRSNIRRNTIPGNRINNSSHTVLLTSLHLHPTSSGKGPFAMEGCPGRRSLRRHPTSDRRTSAPFPRGKERSMQDTVELPHHSHSSTAIHLLAPATVTRTTHPDDDRWWLGLGFFNRIRVPRPKAPRRGTP